MGRRNHVPPWQDDLVRRAANPAYAAHREGAVMAKKKDKKKDKKKKKK